MKEMVIVSWYGESDVGGVERVTYYAKKAWQDMYNITIIDLKRIKRYKRYGMWIGLHYALDALLVSVYTNAFIKKLKVKRKDIIVITQGYNAPFVKADISFAHGTMRKFKLEAFNDKKWHINQFLEKYSWNRTKCLIAVGGGGKTGGN